MSHQKANFNDVIPEFDMIIGNEGFIDDFIKYLTKMPNEIISVLHDWSTNISSQESLSCLMQKAIKREFNERVQDVYDALAEAERDLRRGI